MTTAAPVPIAARPKRLFKIERVLELLLSFVMSKPKPIKRPPAVTIPPPLEEKLHWNILSIQFHQF